MRSSRVSWIASAIVCAFTLSAFAQEPAKPAPAKPAAEPAKPAPAPAPAAKPAAPAAAPAPATSKEAVKAGPSTTTTTTTTTTATTVAAIGKPAPSFSLKDVNGKEVKLADYKDKVVVLEWANAGCPVCQRHAKDGTASKVMANFKDKPVVWVNIDSTGDAKAEDCKKFATDNKLGTYLMDPTGATGKAYGAKTTPHCFVIDQKGNMAYMGAIDDDKDGSKKDKAKNYVKDAIDAVLKGSTVATATSDPYGCSVKYKG